MVPSSQQQQLFEYMFTAMQNLDEQHFVHVVGRANTGKTWMVNYIKSKFDAVVFNPCNTVGKVRVTGDICLVLIDNTEHLTGESLMKVDRALRKKYKALKRMGGISVIYFYDEERKTTDTIDNLPKTKKFRFDRILSSVSVLDKDPELSALDYSVKRCFIEERSTPYQRDFIIHNMLSVSAPSSAVVVFVTKDKAEAYNERCGGLKVGGPCRTYEGKWGKVEKIIGENTIEIKTQDGQLVTLDRKKVAAAYGISMLPLICKMDRTMPLKIDSSVPTKMIKSIIVCAPYFKQAYFDSSFTPTTIGIEKL